MTINKLISECENAYKEQFNKIDTVALYNQKKVLDAFRDERIALRHFSGTSGYGYDDAGRDSFCRLFANIFKAEQAVVSPLIVSGTHAIALMFFSILRPGDTLLSITGQPYDTLQTVISGKGNGSLSDFGINFEMAELSNNGRIDFTEVAEKLKRLKPKAAFIQRSRGYSLRPALGPNEIKEICALIKKLSPKTAVLLDNCYGEFVCKSEPLELGCDAIAGSLIKNPGGGLAPTGGYIAGKEDIVELAAQRLTVPGAGMEVGSYAGDYRYFYQGLFSAPHITAQALKCALLFSAVYHVLGFEVYPNPKEERGDIICSIKLGKRENLIEFCRTIQRCSPIDSFVLPEPWDMPGYGDKVIMAAGSFVQGASIELSADSPIRPPYVAYLQGALTYEHAKIAVAESVNRLGLL